MHPMRYTARLCHQGGFQTDPLPPVKAFASGPEFREDYPARMCLKRRSAGCCDFTTAVEGDMGSVIPIRRRRPARMTWQKPATPEARESMQSLLVLVIVFSVVALAMAAAVVVVASNSWAEAVPLIVVVAVIALTKIVLANAAFYVMIRSDAQ